MMPRAYYLGTPGISSSRSNVGSCRRLVGVSSSLLATGVLLKFAAAADFCLMEEVVRCLNAAVAVGRTVVVLNGAHFCNQYLGVWMAMLEALSSVRCFDGCSSSELVVNGMLRHSEW